MPKAAQAAQAAANPPPQKYRTAAAQATKSSANAEERNHEHPADTPKRQPETARRPLACCIRRHCRPIPRPRRRQQPAERPVRPQSTGNAKLRTRRRIPPFWKTARPRVRQAEQNRHLPAQQPAIRRRKDRTGTARRLRPLQSQVFRAHARRTQPVFQPPQHPRQAPQTRQPPNRLHRLQNHRQRHRTAPRRCL